ncbi:MAG: pentapeptide repeat-containing protein [Kastovskya adunca ATA6-11-RM4]|jgi:uncharacterized protein YjbI with pentapeptide repeats|nr:pentapeptide repeat-containing protein [Kastovskya adunca ATA6-11-RM4]
MNVTEILKKYAQGVRDFSGVNLTEENLSGVNLSGANLIRANLSVANLSGAHLSEANLTDAKLNVARLSGANLSKAKLVRANLNVANLIRADLGEANLENASLIRAELIRAKLSRANLSRANLSGADLREAALRQANLSGATLTEANFRGALLTAATLEQANVNGTDLSRTDLRGANLRDTELRQANLSRADLSGADLSGANLRWADLSGANLSWADLSEAKLSGANLMGADLSNANLLNTSLVHADLTQARLIKADWIGADLTGAILTGAKLYAVSRFGLKTEGMTCEWIDLSPGGDQSEIFRFTSEGSKKFFNETLPTVRIVIDAPLSLDANLVLASTYHQIAQQYPTIKQTPSIEVSSRRTALTFRIDSNDQLFSVAYLAILPFQDAGITQQNILTLVNTLESQALEDLGIKSEQLEQLIAAISQGLDQVRSIKALKTISNVTEAVSFFQAPTQTAIANSSDQTLTVYHHPGFGKHLMHQSSLLKPPKNGTDLMPESTLPPIGEVVEFIKKFDYLGKSSNLV